MIQVEDQCRALLFHGVQSSHCLCLHGGHQHTQPVSPGPACLLPLLPDSIIYGEGLGINCQLNYTSEVVGDVVGWAVIACVCVCV